MIHPLAAWALLLACTPAQPPRAHWVPAGLELDAAEPLRRVRLEEPDGRLLTELRYPSPVTEAHLDWAWSPGQRLVLVSEDTTGQLHREALQAPSSDLPVLVLIEAHAGAPPLPLSRGDSLPFTPGDTLELSLVALTACTVQATLDDQPLAAPTLQPGERSRLRLQPTGPGRLRLELEPGGRLEFELRPEASTAAVSITAVEFPTSVSGQADQSRPPDTIPLPAPTWTALLDRLGLGFRARDRELPFAHQAVSLTNPGPGAANLVVRARVLDATGAPDPRFRPRMRSADDGTGLVSVLLRVPPGETARAVLPLFLDEPALPQQGQWTREITVTPFGATEASARWTGPLTVSQGDDRLLIGGPLSIGAALMGVAALAGPGRRWLSRAPTPDLVVVALFSGLLFVVGTAAQLLGAALGAALGPFSVFFTGLVDDAVSYALLSTLLRLLPRPGVMGLTVTLTALLRGLVTGGLSPFDLLFIGSRVFFLEGALYLFGLTRGGGGWRSAGLFAQWLRLSAGFGLASVASVASSLVLQALLYRLYFADAYVLALLLLPGFVYVLIALALALPGARALARVEGAC